MRLKIISVLLLISLLLNGCGKQSSPPSTANDSVQKTLEETGEKAEEKIEEKIEEK